MSIIYDISLTVSPKIPVWPGDPQVVLERTAKMEEGSPCNISMMQMGVHTGTHVDAPYHFLPEGAAVDSLPLDALVGPAQVVELPETVEQIDAAAVEQAGIQPGVQRVLFKTRNSRLWVEHPGEFQRDFAAILPDAAELLVKLGIRLVGVDYLSVAPFSDGVPTHRILLRAGMVALEGLNLNQVPAGNYTLVCLPMKLAGADGAPARAILIAE